MRLPMASMLESFVSQLLADYLSNYVQGIHPEQFRLGIWNGVAQLENVELRLQAFDYLQLPIAIKSGIVGRLKIQVPWKKLGREPIIITLEDIYICACPRDEFEWKSEALEARSLAAKKAKLAAAELAKLSARISDNNTNQSFFSYLSTKILDNMQVIAERIHFRYIDQTTDPEMAFSFGIKFSYLIMNTEQSISGAGPGRAKSNIVNKLVEFEQLSIYWNSNEEREKQLADHDLLQNECKYLIHPFNASVRFTVNKNPLLDGSTPQFSTTFEIKKLDFTIEDRQLHEMLLLWDALYICQMREKYGQFRPAVGQHGFTKKEEGWQKVWWQYAIHAVLVDVRKALRRTAWSYLGWRIAMRRNYVLLYKEKLDCLWKGKPAGGESLQKLEELEKELDLDEILAFRSIAEDSLKGQVMFGPSEEVVEGEAMDSRSDVKPEDIASQKHRSWLNFLSLGMLGAAGSTSASDQFAGVLPDEIIEDISEATRYHPLSLKAYGELPKGSCRFAITSHISGAEINLRRMHPNYAIASLDMQSIDARIRVWQQSTKIYFSVKTLKVEDQFQNTSVYHTVLGNEGTILPHFSQMGSYQPSYAEAVIGTKQSNVSEASSDSRIKWINNMPFLVVECEILSENRDFDIIINITMQPAEFVYSPTLMKQMNSFISRPSSLRTLKDLILSSLNGLQSPQIRLQSKAELTLAMGKRVSLSIEAQRPVLIFPRNFESLNNNHLIIMINSLQVASIDQTVHHRFGDYNGKEEKTSSRTGSLKFQTSIFTEHKEAINASDAVSNEFVHPAVYDKFHLHLIGVQVIVAPHLYDWQASWKGPTKYIDFHIAKIFDADVFFEMCAVRDEPALTRFKVFGEVPSVDLTFSSKKWRIIKSFISGNSEENVASPKYVSESSMVPVVELKWSNDSLFDDGSPAAHFKLELFSNFMSLLVHSEGEESSESIITLLMKGENASLLFLDSDIKEKLEFHISSLHIQKPSKESNPFPFLSLHSTGNLAISGLFLPNPIWSWELKASEMVAVVRGVCSHPEEVVAVNVKGLQHSGTWKSGRMDAMHLKATYAKVMADIILLERTIEHSDCHLCLTNLACIMSGIEQQQCSEILALIASEALPGVEIDILSLEKNRNVYISMPFLNLRVHFANWRLFFRVLNSYSFLRSDDNKNECNSIPILSTADAQQKDNSIVSTSDHNTLACIMIQSSLMSININLPNHSIEFDDKFTSDSRMSSVVENDVLSEKGYFSSISKQSSAISCNIALQVKNLCYRESLCNFESSIVKCEVRAIDCFPGDAQSIPLLQATGIEVKSSLEVPASNKKSITMHLSVVKRLDIWCSPTVIHFLRSFKFEDGPHAASNIELEVACIMISLERGSLLLTDGGWNYNAPIFELRMRNLNSEITWSCPDQLSATTRMLLEADYHDMEKVAWEPFLEPWDLLCHLACIGTDIPFQQADLKFSSADNMNVNITKAFFQASARAVDLFSATGSSRETSYVSKTQSIVGYAPYWLQNDTGIRLKYWLVGASKLDDIDCFVDDSESEWLSQNIVDTGSSVPINIQETPEQVFHSGRLNSSSERLFDRRSYNGKHRLIRIQLEGTASASCVLSMDLVGLNIFYVTFSHSSNDLLDSKKRKEKQKIDAKVGGDHVEVEVESSAFQMPVVYEVSSHCYSKVIRIYSTVSLVNATTIPMEVRFDIPFGVVPKVMEPILPGEVIPLPVHLAETGQIRWKPMGNSHLWSETQSLSHIFSASKLGSLRAFVSYPSNPSDAIFRCCVMVQENESSKSSISAILKQSYSSMTSSVDTRISSFPSSFLTGAPSDSSSPGAVPIVRELVFEVPFVFKNCLPLPLSLIVNSSAGHELTCRVPECDAIFVLEVNTAHDLALTINVPGFLSASLDLESTTNLVEQHKNDIQNKFSLTRTICLLPDNIHGYSVYCKTESSFNLMSGAREICISVPFWFYNHTGVTLGIVDGDADVHKKNHHQVMQQLIPDFSLFDQELGCFDTQSVGLNTVLSEPALSTNRLFTHGHFCGTTNMRSVGGGKKIISCIPSQYSSSAIENSTKGVHSSKPFVYSPTSDTELGDNRLRARVALPCSAKGALTSHANKFSWSRPFSLNPPGGMTSIVLPVSEEEGGYIVSVVSAPVLGASAGKTRTITFQPRFVLVNACSHDLCYRQQGIDRFQYLMKGEQAHLYWSDMSKPLLVSLRLEQQGWDWSGAFVPDQLGDTQLKMRNMGTGTTQILRVEVQNAGSFQHASNAMPSTDNSLGTFLLLISDDESGFMPYRIENFSLERLRFFQSKCPDFESMLLPYSSCLYAWDEPWRPHQLVVEVPGEGCLGSFDLDDVRDYPVVHIPARNQKPERWFSICVYAEGPTRVLSLQDVHLHPKENLCGRNLKGPFPKHTDEYTGGTFSFNFSFASLGISVMNTFPQEILFATAQDVMITLSQNPHEENLSINISYIQLDNQLPHAQYPVMFLSGICDQNELSNLKEGKRGDSPASGEFFLEQLAFTLAVSKWRHHTSSVECFQKIHARMAPSQVQLDEQIVNCLVEFCRTTRDAGFHPDYHDYDGEIKFSSGREIFLNHRYMLTLDPKSTKFRLLRILKFEDIYKCWPVAEAVNFLRGQTSKDLLLASGGRKVYIESLLIGPIELTVSFSSIPWRDAAHSQNISEESAPFMQQSLLALLDIEEAPVQLGQLFFAHPLARWDAIRGMVIRHYTRQLLHEIYKVLGSVGLLGNPMGFMKSLGLGVREFVSAPAKSFVQSPRRLVGGFAEGTQSLVSNTVFAVSNAATLISRAAKKGVTSLAPGHQQQIGFQDYGVISELLEGLTGLLQSPVTGAARHGLPGILSGVAVGAVGLFARPIASILEAAGRTAQSIRSWSQPIQQAQRIRPPRYLNRGSPIFPYSWEEAVGNAVLLEAAGSCLQNEVYVTCRPLSESGKYAVLTERILLIVKSSATAHGGRPHWIILSKISLDDVLHVERNEKILNILMGSPRCPSGIHGLKKKQLLPYKRDSSTSPLLHESFTMPKEIDAEELSLYIRDVLDRRTKSRTNYIKL